MFSTNTISNPESANLSRFFPTFVGGTPFKILGESLEK